MPIYEYRCDDCGHELEALQKISDPLLTDCPACQTPSLKKLMSAAGFRLKGGGWYETDFKSGDKKKNLVETANSGESKTESKPDAKSEDKSPAKPEAKTESKKTESKKTESKSSGTNNNKAA